MKIIFVLMLIIIIVLAIFLLVVLSLCKEFIRRSSMYLDNVRQLRGILDVLFNWLSDDDREKVIEDYLIDHGYSYPCIYDMRNLGHVLYETIKKTEQGAFAYIDKRDGKYFLLDINGKVMDDKNRRKVDIVIVADQYVSKAAKDNIRNFTECPVVSLGEIINEQGAKMKTTEYDKKVSVIVPVYNTERYLSECIDSVLHQTLDNIEIILIDDGSTDNSGKIVDEYADKYPEVVALHQENQKQGAARNYGLSVAKGEYIAYIDSDDYLTQEALERMYELAIRRHLDAVSYDAQPFFEEGVSSEGLEKMYDRSGLDIDFGRVWKGSDYWNENYKKGGAFINPCFMFCRHDFLKEHDFQFQPNVFYEDNEFGMKIYLCSKRFMCLPEKFYCRRYRSDSTMTGSIKMIHLVSRLVSVKCIWGHIIQYYDIIKQSNASYTFFSSSLKKVLETLDKVQEVDQSQFIDEILSFNNFIWQNEDVLLKGYDAKVMDPISEFITALLQNERLKEYFKAEQIKALNKTIHISNEIERKRVLAVLEKFCIGEGQKICIYGTGIVGKRVSKSLRNLFNERFQEYVFFAQTSVTEEIYDDCKVVSIDSIKSENVGLIIVATTKYVAEMLHTIKKLYNDHYKVLTYDQWMDKKADLGC